MQGAVDDHRELERDSLERDYDVIHVIKTKNTGRKTFLKNKTI